MTGSSSMYTELMKNWRSGRVFLPLLLLTVWINTVQGNNPPRLVNFDGFAQALENAPKGTPIKTLTATDSDGPNEISFQVDRNSPETKKLVYLGPPTGTSNTGRSVEIFLNVSNLDRDYAAPERQLRFEVLDGLNSPVYASMTLFIQDVNDEAPQFRGTPYRTTVKEDTQVGTLVFNGTQTVDPDTGIGGAVTYSLELTDEAYRTTFRVTPYEGHIYLNETLDYEKHNFYQLQLTARDGYNLSTTTDVIVTVDDVQDTKPNFVNTPYRTIIREDAAIDTSVISVSALDGDRGNSNPIKYSFVNDTSNFNIHEDSGLITVASKLDSSVLREQGSVYDLTVRATEVDVYLPQRGETTATMLVLITVEDVNDHAPRFNRSHYNGSVSENAQRGIPVKLDGLLQSIYVEDLDQNDNSIFEVSVMQNGRIYNVFNLRPNIVFSEGNLNMLVEDNSILDYEALMINQLNNVLTFTVRATETKTAERLSGEATFTVYVIDENDNFPQFTQSVYEVYINEHSPNGTVVTTITATDKDSGVYGEVSYTLQRGGDGKFRMLPNGTVIVEDGTDLDRERLDYYYLTVEARDGGGNRNLTQLIITLNDTNDHPPTFLRTQLTQFVEENKLFPPLILSASDADLGVNREVEYKLTLLPPSLQQNISLTTTPDGEANITISPNLDYEKLAPDQRSSITLEVTATDKGSPPLSSTATVFITVGDQNDMPPIFDQVNYSGSIKEDARGKTLVVNVSATDDDGKAPNNEIQYSIAPGAEDKFYIDTSSGHITVADGVTFDRDTKDMYILKVLAQDKGSPQNTGTTNVTVTILDVNNKPPKFKLSTTTMSIQENATEGTSVGLFTASDQDDSANLTYKLLINNTKGFDESGSEVADGQLLQIRNYFTVEPLTGQISVDSNNLDRETAEVVVVIVQVTDINADPDHGEQTATGTVTITLLDYNDNPPDFSMPQGYHWNVSEREVQGYEILTISATDKDKDQSVLFDQITGTKFRIDPSSGKVTLLEKLDREASEIHTFAVVAHDNGNPELSSTTTVTITVLDDNDNSPQFKTFSPSKDILENSTVNTSVIRFEATDADIGKYAEINFFIESGNVNNAFRLNRTTGELFVNGPLDRETLDRYQLRIEARDNFNDPEPSNMRSNTTMFTVIVTDVNDNAPIFNGTVFKAKEEVKEDRDTGFVYTITATDKDEGNNGKITYELGSNTNATDASDEYLFKIESSTGEISVARSLVDSVGWRYLTVIAKDGGSPQKSSNATVMVNILDVNFYDPVFTQPSGPINVWEGTGVGAFVYQFDATDKDQGENGRITYELTTSLWKVKDNDPVFSLNETTGNLTTKIDLDFETQKVYTVNVQASDHGKPVRSSRMSITVNVIDKDDNPPKFKNQSRDTPTEFIIEENKIGRVGVVQAFDIDTYNTSQICYCFLGDHTNFTLDISTGEIMLVDKIDRETSPGPRDLLIRALQFCNNNCDSARRKKRAIEPPALYNKSDFTMLWVRVNIKDTNDNKPVFTVPEISVGITRDTQYGAAIMSLSEFVTDKDEPGNNSLHNFALIGDVQANLDNLKGENVGEMFKLSPSGQVSTNTYFKSDWFGFFFFKVRVSDAAGNTTADVKIYLINKDQQVKIVILGSPASVNKSKALIVEQLENATGGLYDIIVDKVQTHEDKNGKPDPFKIDLFIHGVEKSTKTVIAGSELLRLIDSKIRLLIETYKKYSVVEVVPAVAQNQDQSEELSLKMALILVAVILTMLVIVLGLSFFFCRKKYKRKLRAATAMAFVNTGIGTKESEMNKMDMPGTNLHAFEGSNPIWMEKYDNLGMDDNNSQNSLDANDIEVPQNQFDEQEVSLDLYNDDYDNFNKLPHSKLGAADLHLNAAIKEHEASKNNKNKDIVNNNADKYAVNGSVKYSNGSVDSFNTKNVNGLQTTEI